jgi:DNA-binding beta-propeller fold protein YncE
VRVLSARVFFRLALIGLSLLALSAAGCGSGHRRVGASPAPARALAPLGRAARARPRGHPSSPASLALVTAESENRIVLVNLRRGRVIRSVPVPADPEYAVATRRVVVAVSPAGTVTLLERPSLRRIRVFTGFAAPHIPAISPDGAYAYVTDDARGTLTTIRLGDARITSKIFVGAGAHHMGISPDGRSLWIALGQAASKIVLLDSSRPGRPRVVGAFDPGFLAHAVQFAPGGGRVWISSANGPEVAVFSAARHRLLFRVPGGAPPQHIAFAGSSAYVTSGYGSTIERVSLMTGHVLRRVGAVYGSFELDTGGGYVAASSLLRGTLSIYDDNLDLERTLDIAPVAEDVVILPS